MPIALSRDEWARMGQWADREDHDAIRRREYVQFLDTTSREMTKSWPNSLENVNKRNEELRRARLEAAEAANTNFYKRYIKQKKQQQEQLMFSARDTIFKNKDAPKLLLGAVIETVVQKERLEQLKFMAEQRRLQEERKRQDDDEIIRKAKEWNELVELKKKRRFEANKQHQKEILEQAHEVAERNRKEHETELNLQKIDNVQAEQQMEAIKKFEQDFKSSERKRIWFDMERARQERSAKLQWTGARDQLDRALEDVLLRARAALRRGRARTERQIKQEKQRILDNISQKLESGDAARDAKEQAILDKAVKEKEAIAEARRQADIRKKQEFSEQRAEDRRRFLRDEEQRLRDLHTASQWDIMNRFKNAEIYEDFKEKLRIEKAKKTKEYREDILRLWKERDDREAAERAERRYFYGALAEQKLQDADHKLLTHAAVLLEEAAQHGRPPHALHKAVDRYCKMYRLYPMPELPRSLAAHFPHYQPRDFSQPRTHHAEPAPQTPAATHRDGLQHGHQMEPAKSTEKRQEQGDYKRKGRANGLQRRPSQHDIQLPPIPVKNENCRCEKPQG